MRPEKSSIIDYIREKVSASPFLILVDYTGMKVDHFAELRTRLAACGAEIHVVKNTLLKRTLAGMDLPGFEEGLGGQNAMVTGPEDICAAAKVIKAFRAEFEKPEFRAGILDHAILSVEQVLALAELPSKAQLQANLLSLFLSPASQLVRLLNEPASSFARLLKAKGEQQGEG